MKELLIELIIIIRHLNGKSYRAITNTLNHKYSSLSIVVHVYKVQEENTKVVVCVNMKWKFALEVY